jgi:hypothetical protein
VLLDASERYDRPAASFVASESLFANETLGFHLDVEMDLLLHPLLRGRAPEEFP